MNIIWHATIFGIRSEWIFMALKIHFLHTSGQKIYIVNSGYRFIMALLTRLFHDSFFCLEMVRNKASTRHFVPNVLKTRNPFIFLPFLAKWIWSSSVDSAILHFLFLQLLFIHSINLKRIKKRMAYYVQKIIYISRHLKILALKWFTIITLGKYREKYCRREKWYWL